MPLVMNLIPVGVRPIQNLFTASGIVPRSGCTSTMKHFSYIHGDYPHRIPALMAVALLAVSAPAQAMFQADGGPGGRAGITRPMGREVSDQEHARYQRESGQNRSFEELFRRASSIGRGEYLGVEPDISSNIYRFKFRRPSGNIVWVDMDGRTGRELSVRQ